MPSGDVYSVSIDQTFQSQNLSNVVHFIQVGSDGTGDARDALATVWEAEFKTTLLACMIGDVEIDQLRIRRIHPTTTQAKIEAINEQGSQSGVGMPVGSCAICRFSTQSSGRKGTGFTKVAGASIDFVQDGRADLAYALLLQAYADEFIQDYTDAGTGYVFHAAVWSKIDLVARPIEIGIALTRIKTIHSRQIGVGS